MAVTATADAVSILPLNRACKKYSGFPDLRCYHWSHAGTAATGDVGYLTSKTQTVAEKAVLDLILAKIEWIPDANVAGGGKAALNFMWNGQEALTFVGDADMPYIAQAGLVYNNVATFVLPDLGWGMDEDDVLYMYNSIVNNYGNTANVTVHWDLWLYLHEVK
jgi:hypothetical protein